MIAAHGVMFHHFWNRQHPRGQGAISAGEFRALVEDVGIERILPAREWLRRAVEGTLNEQDRCLSFDDGLRCQYDVAFPVIRELGLTAFWFPYTGPLAGEKDALEIYRYFRTVCFEDVERFHDAFDEAWRDSPFRKEVEARLEGFDPRGYLAQSPFYTDGDRRFRYLRDVVLGAERYQAIMDDMMAGCGFDVEEHSPKIWMDGDHLRALHDQGHVIGLHSHTHPTMMVKLPPARQAWEYRTCAGHLLGITGEAPVCVSYPCNSYDQGTLELLSAMGVQIGFCANMASVGRGAMELPREDHINILKRMAPTHDAA